MRLLVVTQVVDIKDPDLGFFHEWLEKISTKATSVVVVCLRKGEYRLPANTQVYSLGKENGNVNSIKYIWRFYKTIWKIRNSYDGVFVHMNPEYVILAGLFWRITNKRILFWYMHKAVNIRLRIAEKFAGKIFTASAESFRLKSKKVSVVGHGISFKNFSRSVSWPAQHGDKFFQLISVGRISPVKDHVTIVKALALLKKCRDLPKFSIRFIGEAITAEDKQYKKNLHGLYDTLLSVGDGGLNIYSVSHLEMAKEYQNSHVLIHTSRTGSLDKVVLEALACGRIVVSSSEAFRNLAENELKGVVFYFPPGDSGALADTLESIFKSGMLESADLPCQKAIKYIQNNHNLDTVIQKIQEYFLQRS